MKKTLFILISTTILFSACGDKATVGLRGRTPIPPPPGGGQAQKPVNDEGELPTTPGVDSSKLNPYQLTTRMLRIQNRRVETNIFCTDRLEANVNLSPKFDLKVLVGSTVVTGQITAVAKEKSGNRDPRVPMPAANSLLNITCLADEANISSDAPALTLFENQPNEKANQLIARVACVSAKDLEQASKTLLFQKEGGADILLTGGSKVAVENTIVSCEATPAPVKATTSEAPKPTDSEDKKKGGELDHSPKL